VTLLPIHVVAGLVAIGAAAVTLFATKGCAAAPREWDDLRPRDAHNVADRVMAAVQPNWANVLHGARTGCTLEPPKKAGGASRRRGRSSVLAVTFCIRRRSTQGRVDDTTNPIERSMGL
jgi:hypothetical protein